MENNFTIIDNFLEEQYFQTLRDHITTTEFQWCFSEYVDSPEEGKTPGQFVHVAYHGNIPLSQFYHSVIDILHYYMDVAALYRIKLNLQTRLPESFAYSFHSDLSHDFEEVTSSQWTTAILYINTNNGYTEFETGEKVESVANRVVMFPSNIKHRSVTQTDEQTRILINFNFMRRKSGD